MMFDFSRRRVLRGMIGGAAISLGVPILDCFLNSNGTALASGVPLPTRFGAWHWGLGLSPGQWIPAKTGTAFDIPPQLRIFEPHIKHMNVFSGFDVPLSGKASIVHYSGTFATITGTAPGQPDRTEDPTLDVVVSDAVGSGTRFRSLQLTTSASDKASYSRRNAASINPAETTALAFYKRVFGSGYQDPNASTFTPNPQVLLDKSVVAAVQDDRQRLVKSVGASDRARLDQYFTSLRELETQLSLQLQRPPPAEACVTPEPPPPSSLSIEIEALVAEHKLMTRLLAMALACNQTKVFTMALTTSQSEVYRSGDPRTHHIYTHEEAVNEKLGYQPVTAIFTDRYMVAFSDLISACANISEGAGTLLDNTLIFAYSDTSYAKTHAVNGIPVLTVGKAGGRLKTGNHVAGNGTPITRIGLTALQAMGIRVGQWGKESLQTSSTISEILA
jgi:hypothetical protein